MTTCPASDRAEPRPSPAPLRPAALVLTAVLALAACGGGEPSGPPPPPTLTVVGGGSQEGPVGLVLPAPVAVQLRDRNGPVVGASVRFEAASGGGTVSPGTALTDASGGATAQWLLGGTLGEQTLRVTSGAAAALLVTATGTIGPPTLLVPVAGNSQFAVVGRPVAIPPQVRLTDAFGNAIVGATITFTQVSGGGRLTDSVRITGADGGAALGGWTLGPAAGTNRIRATAGTLTAELVAFGTPAVVTHADGNGQQANAGTLVPVLPAVVALDGDSKPLSGVVVQWAVQGGGGSVLGASSTTDPSGTARVGGWILGLAPGPNTLSAQVAGLPSAVFTATGIPATPTAMLAVGATAFAGLHGNFVAGRPSVRITDAQGRPVAGTPVVFEVTAGEGTLGGAMPRTDFDGRATLGGWRLGPMAALQSVRATAAGLAPVTFQATATAPPPPAFTIEVRFIATPTPAQKEAFDSAAARWQRIILGDLPDIAVELSGSGCFPPLSETVDDILIFADLTAIDGAGGILGSAGPCLIRSTSGLTIVGRMRFDTADLATLESSGRLRDVILHEMGHVLGIGSLWDLLELITGRGGSDPFFTGLSAAGAFLAAAGPAGFAGSIVPVENTGAAGTRDVHWREVTLANELMTGFINAGLNPLSAITAASLRDEGYVVDDAQSDPYSLPSLLTTLGTPAFLLREVPLAEPIWLVSPSGRLERSIPRL